MKPFIRPTMILIISATLGLSVTLGGCDRFRNFSDQEHVQRAKDFLGKNDLRAAEIEFKNAIGKNPKNAEARWLLGELYLETEQGAPAEKELRRAQELGVGQESLKVPLARAYLLQGKFKEVLDGLNPGPQASARNQAQLAKLRGDALLGLRRGREACESYAQSKQMDAEYVDAYRGLALCAVGLDKDAKHAQELLAQALQLVNQALAKSPRDFESLMLKGELLKAMAKTGEAGAIFGEALKLRPNHVGARVNSAAIAIEENKLDEARGHIEKARKAQPQNIDAIYMAALLDYRQGKFAQARDSVQQAIKLAPGHQPSVSLFGAVSLSLGAYEQAERALSFVLAQSPGNTYVRQLLATTLLKQGKPSLALDTLKPLLPQAADVQTLALAGEVYMALKEPRKAAEYFEQAAQTAPDNTEVQTGLAVSRLAGGDLQSGIAELEKASQMDPKHTRADGTLIITYIQLRQYDKALAAIDVLEKKQPNSPLVHNLRAGAYLGKRDLVSARKAFEQALEIDPAFMPAAQNLVRLDIQDKKPDAARKRLQNVLAKDGKNLAAMLTLADIAASENKEQEYLAWLGKAASADPKALEPKAKQIGYYLGKRENQKALTIARDAQSANNDSPQAWALLGRTQLAAGEKENAITSFTKATQLAPDAPRLFLDLGVAQNNGGHVANARASLGRALTLNPDYLEARQALLALELQENRGAAALKLAEEQSRRQPKSPVGLTLEGDVHMAQEQFAAAAKAYERAFALAKSTPLATKIHQAMFLAGNAKEADAHLLAWINDHPSEVGARLYWADSLARRKDYKSAAAHYEIALKNAPDNAMILNNLASAYNALKDARALATAERAYSLQPTLPHIQDTLGWILLAQGQSKRGLDLLKQAAAAAPDSGEIRYHYAEGLAKTGDKSKAKAELDAVLKSPATFPSRSAAQSLRERL